MADPCRRHGHPSLSRPVALRTVAAELGLLKRRMTAKDRRRVASTNRLIVSAELTREHQRANPALYGQVSPDSCAVEIADQLRWLPKANRLGVLAHELGHCLDPEGGQLDADRAAEQALSRKGAVYRIEYDKRWPHGGLQRLVKK